MKRRIWLKPLYVLLALTLLLTCLGACSGEDKQANAGVDAGDYDRDLDPDDHDEDEEEETDVSDEEQTASDEEAFSVDKNGAGGCVVTCDANAAYGADVVVFSSQTDYDAFQNADTFTNGEFEEAVEKHAWAHVYLNKGEKGYLGLKEGNVVLVNGGKCHFQKYNAASSQTLYTGVYVVGEDLPAGSITFKKTERFLDLSLFANKDRYLGYFRSPRYTNGEEWDALEEYADFSDSVYSQDGQSLSLQNGMILLVGGNGQF